MTSMSCVQLCSRFVVYHTCHLILMGELRAGHFYSHVIDEDTKARKPWSTVGGRAKVWAPDFVALKSPLLMSPPRPGCDGEGTKMTDGTVPVLWEFTACLGKKIHTGKKYLRALIKQHTKRSGLIASKVGWKSPFPLWKCHIALCQMTSLGEKIRWNLKAHLKLHQ